MDNSIDKALEHLCRMADLVDEANDIIDNLTIDNTDNHTALDESVAKMKKLVDEMKERKERLTK